MYTKLFSSAIYCGGANVQTFHFWVVWQLLFCLMLAQQGFDDRTYGDIVRFLNEIMHFFTLSDLNILNIFSIGFVVN